jgi:YNFM family putative membrane transporter
MKTDSPRLTRTLVFLLVGSAFTTVYITQPVLPVIENEFAIDARTASLSVSTVIFGIALANLPFGMLADRSRAAGSAACLPLGIGLTEIRQE